MSRMDVEDDRRKNGIDDGVSRLDDIEREVLLLLLLLGRAPEVVIPGDTAWSEFDD